MIIMIVSGLVLVAAVVLAIILLRKKTATTGQPATVQPTTPKHVTLTSHGMIATVAPYNTKTAIPDKMKVKFYTEEGTSFLVSNGKYLWGSQCQSTTLEYPATLKDGSPSVKIGGKTWTDEYRHNVYLTEATKANDGFDDGIYLHSTTPKSKGTCDLGAPQFKLTQVPGFVKGRYGQGWVTLEDALKFIHEKYGDDVVLHGMFCLNWEKDRKPDGTYPKPARRALEEEL